MSIISKLIRPKFSIVTVLLLVATLVWGQEPMEAEVESMIRGGQEDEAMTMLAEKGDETNPEHLILWGQAYLQKGRTDMAEEYMRKALDESRAHAEKMWTAESAARLGVVLWVRGQNHQSLQYLLNALDMRRELDDQKGVAASYNDIGLVYSNLDPELARYYYQQALELYDELYGPEDERTINATISLAFAYLQLGEHEQALENLNSALVLRRQQYPESHVTEGFVLAALGQVYAAQDMYDEAHRYYEQALRIYGIHYGEKHPEIANLHNLQSSLFLEQNDFDGALSSVQSAMNANTSGWESSNIADNPVDQEYYNPDVMLTSLLLKGQGYEKKYFGHSLKKSDLESSLRVYEIGDQLIDELRYIRTNQEDKIFLSSQAAELYENAIAVSLTLAQNSIKARPYQEKAFYFNEKGKSIVLLDAITDSNAKEYANIPEDLLEKESELLASIQFINQKLAEGPEAELEQQLRQTLLTLTDDYNAFVSELETSFPQYFNLKYNVRMPSVEELQATLPSNTAIRSYFVASERRRLYIFQLTQGNYRVYNLPLSDDFERHQIAFRNSIIFDLEKYYREFSGALHSQLMPGGLSSRIDQLLIIPAGSLGLIPFEALVKDPQSDQGYSQLDYVLNRYKVSYQYSAALYFQQWQSASERSGTAVLFAPVEFNYENEVKMGALPGTEREVKQIGEILSDRDYDTRELLFADASEAEIKSSDLSNYDFLHIASHGVVNETHPELTCIFLSEAGGLEDGLLYAGEIYGLDLNAQLVTMSACQTGMGKVAKGEGIIGFSRALLFAGARNILVSLWRVNDLSTSQMMTTFYNSCITDTRDFTTALSEAKKRMIQNPETSNPYHWASFILVGDGR